MNNKAMQRHVLRWRLTYGAKSLALHRRDSVRSTLYGVRLGCRSSTQTHRRLTGRSIVDGRAAAKPSLTVDERPGAAGPRPARPGRKQTYLSGLKIRRRRRPQLTIAVGELSVELY